MNRRKKTHTDHRLIIALERMLAAAKELVRAEAAWRACRAQERGKSKGDTT